MREMICISCPKGCHLSVEEIEPYRVVGNLCPRGDAYGKSEITNPMRIVTSTVWLDDNRGTCPVKTDHPIPKADIFRAVACLKHAKVASPIKRGQIIVPNICGEQANFIATKDI